MQNTLKMIANYYGDKQFLQTIEELSELIQAICKYQRFKSNELSELVEAINRYNCSNRRNCKTNYYLLMDMLEEIADVEIMTAQLKLLLNAESDVEEIKKAKIQRQLDRIEQEVKNKC